MIETRNKITHNIKSQGAEVIRARVINREPDKTIFAKRDYSPKAADLKKRLEKQNTEYDISIH